MCPKRIFRNGLGSYLLFVQVAIRVTLFYESYYKGYILCHYKGCDKGDYVLIRVAIRVTILLYDYTGLLQGLLYYYKHWCKAYYRVSGFQAFTGTP